MTGGGGDRQNQSLEARADAFSRLKSDDFLDLTLAQYNLKKWYFYLVNMGKKVLGDEKRV